MKNQMSLSNIKDDLINGLWVKQYVHFVIVKNTNEVQAYLKVMKKRLNDSSRADCMDALPKIILDMVSKIIHENVLVQLTALINLRKIINMTVPDARPHLSFLVDHLKLMMVNKDLEVKERSVQHMYILLELLPDEMGKNFFNILPYFMNVIVEEHERHGTAFDILGRFKILNKIRIFVELYYERAHAQQVEIIQKEMLENAACITHLLTFVLTLWQEITCLTMDIHLHSLVNNSFSDYVVPRTALTKTVAKCLNNVMTVSFLIHNLTNPFHNFLREHGSFYNKHVFVLFPCLAVRFNNNINVFAILDTRNIDVETTLKLNELTDKLYPAFNKKDISKLCLKELKLFYNIMNE